MVIERVPETRVPCGVQGCLFGAVALFVLLLIGLLIIAFFRFQEPPVPRVENRPDTPRAEGLAARVPDPPAAIRA